MTHPRLHGAVNPGKLAVLMSDGSPGLTYGELEDRANGGGQLLRSLRIGPRDKTAYWLPNCPEVFEVQGNSGLVLKSSPTADWPGSLTPVSTKK